MSDKKAVEWSDFAVKFSKLLDAKITLASHELEISKEAVVVLGVHALLKFHKETKEGNKIVVEDADGDTKVIEWKDLYK